MSPNSASNSLRNKLPLSPAERLRFYRTLGSSASVIETPQARHSKDCNSGNPPILGIERTGRMAAPQLGQHGAKWYSWCMSPPSARAFTSTE